MTEGDKEENTKIENTTGSKITVEDRWKQMMKNGVVSPATRRDTFLGVVGGDWDSVWYVVEETILLEIAQINEKSEEEVTNEGEGGIL